MAKKRKRKQGHPAKAQRPKPDVQVPPHPFIGGTTPDGAPLQRMTADQRVEGLVNRARAATDTLDPQKLAEYESLGLTREVDTVVGGEGVAAQLSGLMTDKATGRIVGTLPDSPASKLTREQLVALSGKEFDYAPDEDWLRLERVLEPESELHRKIRELAPHGSLDEQGNFHPNDGLNESERLDKVDELTRVLRKRAHEGDDRARKMLEQLGQGMGNLSVTESGKQWRAGTLAGLQRANEKAAVAVPEEERSPITAAFIREAIVEHLHDAAVPGWGVLPKNPGATDVELRRSTESAQPTFHIDVRGEMAESVALVAKANAVPPESVVDDAVRAFARKHKRRITGQLDITVRPITKPGIGTLAGDTPEQRMMSAALQQLVHRQWPEGEPYGTELRVKKPIPITWVGLANLVQGSRANKLPLCLTQEDMRGIEPHAMHEVLAGWRQQGEHGTFVRVALSVRARLGKNMALLLHDVSPQTWEALSGMGADVPLTQTVEALDAGMPKEYRLGTEDRPRWAGARAFDKVWDQCQWLSDLANASIDQGVDALELYKREFREENRDTFERLRPLCSAAQTALSGLRDCTEVLVDPDQLNAMPQFEEWKQVKTYVEAMHLPFEDVFLDMEGVAGACAMERADADLTLVVRGACVSRDSEGRLTVMPFGGLADTGDVDSSNTYAPMGTVTFGDERTEQRSAWATSSVVETGFMSTQVCADAALANRAKVDDGPRLGFLMNAPSGATVLTVRDAEMGEVDAEMLKIEVAELVAAALVALKALYLMDMSNVEIVQAPLERPARRLAERKGIDIALAVHVRTSSKRYQGGSNGNGDGNHLEYSHRFRVRGHVKHYPPGTKMADAKPKEVTACPRCGRCRKIWTPPFIKGPEDRPLVLKSLVVRD